MATRRSISRAEWERQKSTICQLYVDEDLPLPQVMEQMAREYGFKPSEAQYKRQLKRWKLRKNQTGDFWKHLSQRLKHEKLSPNDVHVFLRGTLISSEKLRKEISRYDLPTMRPAAASSHVFANDQARHSKAGFASLDGIHICAKVQIPRQLILRLPWYEIHDQLKAVSSRHLSGKRDWSPCSFHPRSMHDQTYLLDWETLISQDQEVGSLCMEDYTNENCILRPFSVDYCGLHQVAHHSDLDVGVNVASVFDLPSWLSRTEAFTKTTARIAPFLPQRLPNETEASVNELLDPTSTMRMHVLTSYMALMLANGHLLPLQVDEFLICLDEVTGNLAFDILALGKDPSTRAIVSELLFSAVRLNQPRLVRSALRNGVDVNLRSSGFMSKTLIREAIDHGNIEIVRLLTDAGASITTNMLESCIYHNEDRVKCPVGAGLEENSSSCLSLDYYKHSAFYCPCEEYEFLEASDVGNATLSRHADDLFPLLLTSQLSAITGPVLTEAIRRGVGYRAIEVLLQAGASANECCPHRYVSPGYEFNELGAQVCPLAAAITRGDADMVRLLLNNGANPDGPIGLGDGRIMQDWGEYFCKTPLVVAAECASLDIVKFLLQYGADPNWSTLDTLRAPEKRELIGKCHSKGLGFVSSHAQVLMLYPLQAAASLASPEIAELLLDHGAVTNPGHGTTPLSIAAYFSRIETVDLLITRKALINPIKVDGFGMSPLEGGVLSGSHELVKRLISSGADPNQCSTGAGGKTPLQRASQIGSASMFDTLVEAGATIHSSSVPDHATKLLPGFVKSRHHDITVELLQQGANPDSDDVDGMSPLSAAIVSKDLGLVSLLLKWGADPNKQTSMPRDCLDNVPGDFSYLLRRSGWLVPSLHHAIIIGDSSIVDCLCDSGADVNGTNEDTREPRFTALHLAVGCKNKDLVELLLARGAKIDPPCFWDPSDFRSPLSLAVKMGDRDIAELLLQKGADPNDGYIEGSQEDEKTRLDRGKRLPLEEACFQGNSQLVRWLISSGASAHIGYPLVFLFQNFPEGDEADAEDVGQIVEIMDLLLEHDLSVNRRCVSTGSALQAAIGYARFLESSPDDRQKILRCARRLIDLGADVNAAPSQFNSRTALQAAAEIGDVDLCKYLLLKGAKVNAPAGPSYGVTALQAAAIKGYLRIAQILLEHGADIYADPSPVNGWRAIDGAAGKGQIDMVKFLLDNYNGPRPLSVVLANAMEHARREDQWYVMELLEQYEPPEPGAPTICSALFNETVPAS